MRSIRIGKIIKEVIESQSGAERLSVQEIADRVGRTRANIYRMIKTDYVDVVTLVKLSQVLNHNFLKHFLELQDLEALFDEFKEDMPFANAESLDQLKKENGYLALENSYLKKIVNLQEQQKK